MIPRFKNENIGSVLKIWVAPYFAFQSFTPLSSTRIATGGIVFNNGQQWTEVYCTPGTMGLQLDHKESDHGFYHPVTVVGFVPGEFIETSEALAPFLYVPVVTKVLTANGYYRIAGTPSAPLNLKAPMATGTTPENRAGRAMEISGELLTEPYYLI